MKKNSFVVQLCIGIFVLAAITGCASKPSATLSHAEMRLDDPRMPPDIFNRKGGLEYYWLGSRAPELSEVNRSVFRITNALKNLRIDGNLVIVPDAQQGYIFLAPGKHTFAFSYYAHQNMTRHDYLGRATQDQDIVHINFTNQQIEINMEPGKVYYIGHTVTDATNRNSLGTIALGGRTYATSIAVQNEPVSSYTPPALEKAKYRKYLEPYDSALPLEKQAFLEIRNGFYIVKFNGNTVRWGGKNNYSVTVGIPEGEHVIQLERASNFLEQEDSVILTITINCLPGHRYSLELTKDIVKAKNVLDNDKFILGIMATDVTGGMRNPIKVTANN